MTLTPQREAFAAALAQGMTQAAAYRVAYPRSKNWTDKTVWSKASALAADGLVSARVTDLVQKAAGANEVTVERVVKEFARLAFVDVRKLYRDDGEPMPIQDLDDDTAAAIASFEVDKDGAIKYKFWDKNSAQERASKILGIFEKDNEQKNSDAAAFLLAINNRIVGVAE